MLHYGMGLLGSEVSLAWVSGGALVFQKFGGKSNHFIHLPCNEISLDCLCCEIFKDPLQAQLLQVLTDKWQTHNW